MLVGRGNPGNTGSQIVNIIANVLYIFNSALVAYLGFDYVSVKIAKPYKRRISQIMILIPLMFIVVLSVSSIWTKTVFYVDASNIYHSGPLIYSHLIIGFGYLLFTAIKVLSRIQIEHQKYVRNELLTLLIFFVFCFFGGLLEMLFPSYPFVWTFSALSLTMVYSNLQSYQISIDELSGLNNRRRFDYYLNSTVSHLSSNDKVHILLGDIDSFKTINDKFGHVEGDHALVCVATILKDIAGRHKAFVARYGGDEFVFVVREKEYSDAMKIQENIQIEMEKHNAISNKLYKITLSIGIGEYCAENPKSIAQLIGEADENLYIEKERMKQNAGK